MNVSAENKNVGRWRSECAKSKKDGVWKSRGDWKSKRGSGNGPWRSSGEEKSRKDGRGRKLSGDKENRMNSKGKSAKKNRGKQRRKERD